MREQKVLLNPAHGIISATAILLLLAGILGKLLPFGAIRVLLLASGPALLLSAALWSQNQRRSQADFANRICETLDALIDNREPENYRPYEDSQISKVQGRLLQYCGRMMEGQRQNRQDKQTIQEFISDISHQVKTPLTTIQMFTNILQRRELSEEKREEFLSALDSQIHKLDFLLQSLVKMSRLEAGTFALYMENNSLYHTIAQAVNSVWAKADAKKILIQVTCDSHITVKHDAKWTAEALGNILDNGVKYTPEGGTIDILVRPWQFYTRIDISDTGMGIAPQHYHHIFQRFYRTQEAASQEGIGLGLYLARGIITRQKGYITVKSESGKGTTFSVFLLN